MATDKLINHSQGESIISQLDDIATNLQNVTAISPAKFGMGYAVCDTAAGTAAKTANIANYVLTEGALVTVKFTNANTASNATLNLNNTGAKPLLYKGSALTTDIISAGDICTFIYSTANSGSYNIINVDALSGAGAGTVKSVGAEGGIITDQTSGAAISTTGSVKLNLKSNTAFTATAPDPVEIENKIYPVALDASGHPAVSVPGTTYTEGTGIDITNNVISNTGVTAVAPSDSSTGTNGTISVTTNGTTTEVAVKGLNNAAYKDVDTTINTSSPSDKLPTSAAVNTAITNAVNALPEPMVFKGSVTGTYPADPSVGDTYKATVDSNSGVTPAYKSGDTVIYATGGWTVIPSGDEPSGTVTAVSVNGTQYDPGTGGVVSLPNYPDISGKIDTAGTGLSKSGTTLNHSNSVSAVTTAGAYKVKYDAQGHITGTSALAASDISAVPTTRTVNSKALSSDITLAASDVGAVPTSRTVNSKALSGNITLAGSDLVLTGYSKGSSTDAVAATDTINAAFAKHENRIDTNRSNILLMMNGVNHNMIYRGQNLGATLTDAQHTALSSGNFTDLYLGDYWTKTVTIPAGTYTGGDGEEVTVPAQTNITLKAVIADFDTFYGGYNSSYAIINTHHAAVIVTGFSNVVWNKTNSTAGGYVASLIHKWLVGSALPQIETWFGSAKVLSHQKLLTNSITGDAASGWAWSSQKIALLSENQMYGSKVWGNSKATNGGYEPGEAHKHLNVFNHIAPNMLFGNKNIWLRDIASAVWAAGLNSSGNAYDYDASYTWIAPAALILLS